MRFLFYVVGLGLALVLGLYPSIQKPRLAIAKWLVIVMITAVTYLSLTPPIVGIFADAVRAREMHLANTDISVLVALNNVQQATPTTLSVQDPENGQPVELQFANEQALQQALRDGSSTQALLRVVNSGTHSHFDVLEVRGSRPSIILPYIPALEERSRIIYFHVPMSWVGFLAFVVTLVYSIRYLRRADFLDETIAASSAGIGTLFCALAYVTGAVWARFNWGHFFNWDTKEFSVLILLLIYAAYFALRSSIDDPERRARLSSVYAIVSCVAALFLLFIVPRITESLHPGSKGDVNSGPLLSTQADAINTTKAIIFSTSLSAFTLLYFWILSLRVRIEVVGQRVLKLQQHSGE